MQGADRVNEEIEVGYDEPFERRWRRAEQVGRWVMVLFVAAGLAGLLGRGPFSHATVASAGTGLAIDFEPVARSQTGTQVTFHLDNPTNDPTVDLFLGSNVVEPMGLQRIVPEPVETRIVNDGMVMRIPVPAGTHDAKLRLMLQPVSLGPNQLIARLAGRPAQRWTQFVVP